MVIQSANFVQNSKLDILDSWLTERHCDFLVHLKLISAANCKKIPTQCCHAINHSVTHMFEDTAGLTFTCVSTTNRFNFGSLKRICQIRVTEKYNDVLTAIALCG